MFENFSRFSREPLGLPFSDFWEPRGVYRALRTPGHLYLVRPALPPELRGAIFFTRPGGIARSRRDNATQTFRVNIILTLIFRERSRIKGTYFFSPSYNKNDSNVGGAFIVVFQWN